MKALIGKGLHGAKRLYTNSRQPRWAMASQVVTSSANFSTTLIIVRSLGLEEFGRFSICFLLSMIARNFLNGMVLAPMSTIAPKLSAPSLQAYRGFLLANGLVFSLGSSALLFVAAVPLASMMNAPWLPQLAMALALASLAANGADFVRRYHFVQESPVRAFMVDAIRYAIQLVLLILLATVWRERFSAESALYVLVAGGFSGLLVGGLHYGSTGWSKRLSRAVWPRHWNYIKWMTPSVVTDTIQITPFFIGSVVLGESAVGLARTMQQLANILNLPFNALQQVAPSMAASVYAKCGIDELRKFLTRMTVWSVVTIVGALTVVIVLSDIILGNLLHLNKTAALPIFLIYCLYNILATLRLPLLVGFQTIELPSVAAISSLFSATATVALAFPIISFFGLIGIPVTNVLSTAVAIFTLVNCMHFAKIRK